MKAILQSMIKEFQQRELPETTDRNVDCPMLKGKATVVTGMRRTGKTSLCFRQMCKLQQSGVDRSRFLYLNFEDDRLFNFQLSDCQIILDVYYTMFPDNRSKLCYFYLDEIQNIQGWERFARRLIDTGNVQLTLTGSSSKLLSDEIATSMRGRCISIEVLPFSFVEYLRYFNIFSELPGFLCDDDCSRLRFAMKRYFHIGGFSEIYQYDERYHRQILQEYANMVILKDVAERHKVTNLPALRSLVKTLFNSGSQKFSVNKFSGTLNSVIGIKCSKNDLYDFMKYLEDAFLAFTLPIHTESERVRQANPAKVYLIDTGMTRWMAENPDANKGHLLENLVYLHLRREGYSMEYITTSKGDEVDFLAVNKQTRAKMLVQVAWELTNDKTFKRETEALAFAGDNLNVAERYIVTWDDETTLSSGISVIPVWKFLIGKYR